MFRVVWSEVQLVEKDCGLSRNIECLGERILVVEKGGDCGDCRLSSKRDWV